MGGKCVYATEIRSEMITNQNIKTPIDDETPINQPRNSIVPQLLLQYSHTTLGSQVMEQSFNNSLILSYERKIQLQNQLEFMQENEERKGIKKSRKSKKSKKKIKSKRKKITMEDLESIF